MKQMTAVCKKESILAVPEERSRKRKQNLHISIKKLVNNSHGAINQFKAFAV